jgi:transposase-like protein
VWGQAKRYLRCFNGIHKDSVSWFLKECGWWFNRSCHAALLYQLKS